MHDIVSRPYLPGDMSACLAIFDSNVPTFFAPQERADFGEFLGSVNGKDRSYLVLARGGMVVACGGLIIEAEERRARMAWGMVDRAFHGQGLGTRLTQTRLALARSDPNIAALGLDASQHSRGFYERFGFVVANITADGFAPGLDRWDMTLQLTSM